MHACLRALFSITAGGSPLAHCSPLRLRYKGSRERFSAPLTTALVDSALTRPRDHLLQTATHSLAPTDHLTNTMKSISVLLAVVSAGTFLLRSVGAAPVVSQREFDDPEIPIVTRCVKKNDFMLTFHEWVAVLGN